MASYGISEHLFTEYVNSGVYLQVWRGPWLILLFSI